VIPEAGSMAIGHQIAALQHRRPLFPQRVRALTSARDIGVSVAKFRRIQRSKFRATSLGTAAASACSGKNWCVAQ
jgi:hypothetical protein